MKTRAVHSGTGGLFAGGTATFASTTVTYTLTDWDGGAIAIGANAFPGVSANGMLADVTSAINATGGFRVTAEAFIADGAAQV